MWIPWISQILNINLLHRWPLPRSCRPWHPVPHMPIHDWMIKMQCLGLLFFFSELVQDSAFLSSEFPISGLLQFPQLLILFWASLFKVFFLESWLTSLVSPSNEISAGSSDESARTRAFKSFVTPARCFLHHQKCLAFKSAQTGMMFFFTDVFDDFLKFVGIHQW